MKTRLLLFTIFIFTVIQVQNTFGFDEVDKNIGEKNIIAATVQTTTATIVSLTSVTLGGSIIDDGGENVIERGIVYSLYSGPTVTSQSSTKVINNSGLENFTETITDLNFDKGYYYRAYAINSSGTSYGDILFFTTRVAAKRSASSYNYAEITANYAEDGVNSDIERGILYSNLNKTPEIDGSDVIKVINNSGDDTFKTIINDLPEYSLYYYRAYATNSSGTSYSEVSSFRTSLRSTYWSSQNISADQKTSISSARGGQSTRLFAVGNTKNDSNGEDAGDVQVYYDRLINSDYEVLATFTGEAAGDNFGASVDMTSSKRLAVGAPGNDGNGIDSGYVRIYQEVDGVWSQLGADILGEFTGDNFGSSVSLSDDGKIVAIGAPGNDGNGIDSGHVRVYQEIDGVWSQLGADIDGETAGDNFGSSISLSGSGKIVAIGAPGNDGNGIDSGHVRVYQEIDGVWSQLGNDIDGEAAGDNFGIEIKLSRTNILAVGATGNDGNGINAGHVRIFEESDSVWSQVGEDIDGENPGDNFGVSISFSDSNTYGFSDSGSGNVDIAIGSLNYVSLYTLNRILFAEYSKVTNTAGNGVLLGGSGSTVITLNSLAIHTQQAILDVDITDITTKPSSAEVSVEVTQISRGRYSGRQWGVAYGTDNNPSNQVYENEYGGFSSSPYSVTIGGLEPSTTYYFRAFADGYRSDVRSRNLPAEPIVTTIDASLIESKSATLSGSFTNQSLLTIDKIFFDIPGQGSDIIVSTSINSGDFSTVVDGLEPNTLYTFRANIETQSGSTYSGSYLTFTTAAKTTPTTNNGSWSDPENWANGIVPSETDDVSIPPGTTLQIGDEISEIKSLVNEGTIVINPTFSLKTITTMVNNGSIIMDSENDNSSVLFITGEATGNVVYKRGGLKANKWSLVTPPVTGQKIKEFAVEPDNDIRVTTGLSPNQYAIGYYDNSESSGQKWKYYTTDVAPSETFIAGDSYSMSRATDGSVTFTGTLTTANASKTLIAGQWNPIGNPFTTYYPANKNGDNSFLNQNYDALDDGFKGIYMWDNNQNKFIPISELDISSRSLTPGQGFFIKLKAGVTDVQFNEDKRTLKPNEGNTSFAKNNDLYVELALENNDYQVKTAIKFYPNATFGFDTGYDIRNFDGASFDLFSHLADNSSNDNYSIQSLPNTQIENSVIPLGLNLPSIENVKFAISAVNLPEGINVVIEDRLLRKDYMVSTENPFLPDFSEETTTKDRFFVHFKTTSALSSETLELDNVNVFVNKRVLHIEGVKTNKVVKISNMIGQEILNESLDINTNKINLPQNIEHGIYLISVSVKNQIKSQKIIIK
ncbi:T9SS type A sorting domain-containing protein [Polaribacter sp. R77954]|uniref:T9SS type A sorting domain-containing protein n=1 Tax=Polaribacter sp. R77954 TaxID=3093870 RepID=UPI0037C6214C